LANHYLALAAGGALVCCGVVMVVSAASVYSQVDGGDPYQIGRRQLLFAASGAVLAFVASKLPTVWLRRLAWPALVLSLGMMALTYSPLAVDINGNQNWVRLGPFQFQPSEFAKLGFIVWGAQHLALKDKLLKDLRQWLSYVLVSALLIGLVLVHDLGSAVVMTAMFVATLFLAGAPLRLIGLIAAAGAAGLAALLAFKKTSLIIRLVAWTNPDSYQLSYNFQANHGLYALASGGFWGLGLGASRQKWGGLMTTGYTDYILAIIGEELGLAGTLTVIGLFLLLAYAGLSAARRCADPFVRLTATGLTVWFFLQAVVNMAVVLRWLPVLGVTLPFVSYGGSSLWATMIGLGLLLGCAKATPEAQACLRGEAEPGQAKITQIFSRRETP
jgi:cell division protein FtsW